MNFSALAVLVLSSGTLFATVGAAIWGGFLTWIRSRRQKSVTIKITLGDDVLEMNSADPDQAAKIIQAFLSEHPQDPKGTAE